MFRKLYRPDAGGFGWHPSFRLDKTAYQIPQAMHRVPEEEEN